MTLDFDTLRAAIIEYDSARHTFQRCCPVHDIIGGTPPPEEKCICKVDVLRAVEADRTLRQYAAILRNQPTS